MERDWKKMLLLSEALVKSTVPELARVPLYFQLQDGTPFAGSRTAGWTSPSLDTLLKKKLGDKWAGRGVGVLFNADYLESAHPQEMETAVLGLAIHEIGHALADGWATTRHSAPDNLPESQTTIITAALKQNLEATDSTVDKAEFYGHDEKWIRVCVHLAFRASRFIYMPPAVVIGRRPELHNAHTYATALVSETASMMDKSFAEILNEPLPAAFAELWEEDRQDFERSGSVPAVSVPLPGNGSFSMNVLDKVFAKITGRKAAKQKTAMEQYRAIVAVLADDEEPGEDEIESVLDAVGKTVEQLTADVSLLQRRRQLRVIVERGAGVAAERARLDQKHAALTATFEAAERAFHEAVAPIQARNLELDSIERQATEARGELSRTCDDETIPPSFEALGLERAEITKRRQALEQARKEFKRQISSAEVMAYNHTKGKPEEVLEAQRTAAPASREALAKVEGEIAELDTEVRELGRRENVLQEKMVMV